MKTEPELKLVAAVAEHMYIDGYWIHEIGTGYEHLFHELLHYVLTLAKPPKRHRKREWEEEEFTGMVSDILVDEYDDDETLRLHELDVVALGPVLAARFGLKINGFELVQYAQGNLPRGWTLQQCFREVRLAKSRLGPNHWSLDIAERYVRDVGESL